MASVEKRPNGQWRARWREYPGGPQRAKHFDRKVDAERFLVGVEHSKLVGTYVDPAAAKVTVERYAETWLERMRPTWRSSTVYVVERSVRRHIAPSALGKRALGAVRRSDVEAWAASLQLGPGTVATVRQHLGQLLTAAVEDGLIPRNPAAGAKLPRIEAKRARPVPVGDIERISAALQPWARIAVPLAAGLGLRQGEACGLTVDRIDFLRRTVQIDRQYLTPSTGPAVFAEPKTASSYRTIPLPTFVVDALAAHLAAHDAGEDGVVLHQPNGSPMNRHRFGAAWRAAVAHAEVGSVRYHDLRHTFASTLLSAGVSVKAVADWLGHASPTITLETYAHLMPIDEDRARSVLDRAFARPAEDWLRTESG